MNEIVDELSQEESSPKTKLLFSYAKYKFFIWLGITALLIAVYVGTLLFGKNSFEVLLKLDDEHDRLEREVEDLNRQNAQLQKDYFEYKQLEGNRTLP